MRHLHEDHVDQYLWLRFIEARDDGADVFVGVVIGHDDEPARLEVTRDERFAHHGGIHVLPVGAGRAPARAAPALRGRAAVGVVGRSAGARVAGAGALRLSERLDRGRQRERERGQAEKRGKLKGKRHGNTGVESWIRRDLTPAVGAKGDIGTRGLTVAGRTGRERVHLLLRGGRARAAREEVSQNRLHLLHVAVLHRVNEDLLLARRARIELRDDVSHIHQGFF